MAALGPIAAEDKEEEASTSEARKRQWSPNEVRRPTSEERPAAQDEDPSAISNPSPSVMAALSALTDAETRERADAVAGCLIEWASLCAAQDEATAALHIALAAKEKEEREEEEAAERRRRDEEEREAAEAAEATRLAEAAEAHRARLVEAAEKAAAEEAAHTAAMAAAAARREAEAANEAFAALLRRVAADEAAVRFEAVEETEASDRRALGSAAALEMMEALTRQRSREAERERAAAEAARAAEENRMALAVVATKEASERSDIEGEEANRRRFISQLQQDESQAQTERAAARAEAEAEEQRRQQRAAVLRREEQLRRDEEERERELEEASRQRAEEAARKAAVRAREEMEAAEAERAAEEERSRREAERRRARELSDLCDEEAEARALLSSVQTSYFVSHIVGPFSEGAVEAAVAAAAARKAANELELARRVAAEEAAKKKKWEEEEQRKIEAEEAEEEQRRKKAAEADAEAVSGDSPLRKEPFSQPTAASDLNTTYSHSHPPHAPPLTKATDIRWSRSRRALVRSDGAAGLGAIGSTHGPMPLPHPSALQFPFAIASLGLSRGCIQFEVRLDFSQRKPFALLANSANDIDGKHISSSQFGEWETPLAYVGVASKHFTGRVATVTGTSTAGLPPRSTGHSDDAAAASAVGSNRGFFLRTTDGALVTSLDGSAPGVPYATILRPRGAADWDGSPYRSGAAAASGRNAVVAADGGSSAFTVGVTVDLSPARPHLRFAINGRDCGEAFSFVGSVAEGTFEPLFPCVAFTAAGDSATFVAPSQQPQQHSTVNATTAMQSAANHYMSPPPPSHPAAAPPSVGATDGFAAVGVGADYQSPPRRPLVPRYASERRSSGREDDAERVGNTTLHMPHGSRDARNAAPPPRMTSAAEGGGRSPTPYRPSDSRTYAYAGGDAKGGRGKSSPAAAATAGHRTAHLHRLYGLAGGGADGLHELYLPIDAADERYITSPAAYDGTRSANGRAANSVQRRGAGDWGNWDRRRHPTADDDYPHTNNMYAAHQEGGPAEGRQQRPLALADLLGDAHDADDSLFRSGGHRRY